MSGSGKAYTLGPGGGGTTKQALDRVAETTQLDERGVGVSIGQGLTPPYPPDRLAALQEISGTHGVAIKKKAKREVGFGFELVPHEMVDNPSDEEKTRAEEFWRGPDTLWKIGPRGTPAASPDEVFEQARQDWHGIGWLAIELMYTADDHLAGLAHLPARTVRVRKDPDAKPGEQKAGHGYVQVLDGQTRYFAEAGDRYRETVDGADDAIFVDLETGDVTDDRPDEPANELLFIINPHPNSLYYGIPAWIAEVETMVGDYEARRFNREFFEWDAMGQYFVMVEGGRLTEASRESVTKLIQDLRDKDGRRVAVLEAEELAEHTINGDGPGPSIKIEQVQQHSDEDQAFTDYRVRNEHDIAKVHEVPPQLIGVMENSNRSNIKEAIRDFTKEVIEPRQERFAGRLYRIIHQQVLDIHDWTIEFETKGARNEAEEADVLATRAGALDRVQTVNELREEAGMEPMDGPVGEMLVVEVTGGNGGGGGPAEFGRAGDALVDALDRIEDEATTAAEVEARIQRGALADADD